MNELKELISNELDLIFNNLSDIDILKECIIRNSHEIFTEYIPEAEQKLKMF